MGTSTIASSGGDYTSLNAWEAAKQADITSSGDEIAECEAFTDSTATTIIGWTTNASNRIIIRAATGHEHGATPGAGYVLSQSGVGTHTLTISEEFVKVEGIEVKQTAGSGSGRPIQITGIGATNELVIKGCIISGGNNYGINNGDGDAIIWMYNNIVYDFTDATNGRGIWAGATDDHTYFNTVYNCGDMGIGNSDDVAGCLVVDGFDDYNSGCTAGAGGAGYNMSSDGGAPGTTTDTNETTAIFENSGSRLLRLASGSTDADDFVVGYLTDEDGNNITTDIIGNTRPSTSDAGAHHFTAAAAGGGQAAQGRGLSRGMGRGVSRGFG